MRARPVVPSAIGVTNRRARVLDEVVDLLPVGDPGERRVLPADEHAGVQHHGDEEARLAWGQPGGYERVRARVIWSASDSTE